MQKYIKSLAKSFLIVLAIFVLYLIIAGIVNPGTKAEIPFWLMVVVLIGSLLFDPDPGIDVGPRPSSVSRWIYAVPIFSLIAGAVLSIYLFDVLNISLKERLFLFVGSIYGIAFLVAGTIFYVVLPALAQIKKRFL